MSGGLLELQDLEAYYGTAQALFGITLRVHEGEVLALLGRNGAGKSTTLKSVMRLGVRTRGRIAYDGLDLASLGTSRVARLGIGYVPEDRRIFPAMTTRENLMLGRYIAREGRPPLPVEAILQAFPTLEPLMARRGGVLSGGEQQLLAVARALIGNPRLMLLDEPSEGLAPKILVQLRDAIAMVHRRFGVTVLLTEQNSMFALALAHSVAIIDSGRIAFAGTGQDLRGRPDLMQRFLGVVGRHAPEAADA